MGQEPCVVHCTVDGIPAGSAGQSIPIRCGDFGDGFCQGESTEDEDGGVDSHFHIGWNREHGPVWSNRLRDSVQAMETGTIVKVTVGTQGDKVAMDLTYESSALQEITDEDSPPNINKTKINASLQLELGKPSLVGGATSSSSSIIVATVTQI